MKTVRIEPNLKSWREAARSLLSAGIEPSAIIWSDSNNEDFLFDDGPIPNSPTKITDLSIPKGFFQLAELVSCHSDEERWGLLYMAAWRLTKGGEGQLLSKETDPVVRRLSMMSKAVSRDRHKMKAFVRFRLTGTSESGREQFVAWFEPEHYIVELTSRFFAKRFASFDWSILTPKGCAHWDGEKVRITGAISRDERPKEDALEEYWRTYYRNIFNPARLKLKAMQAEMPKKYWRNLPEAPLIRELTESAPIRVQEMVANAPNLSRAHVSSRLPKGASYPDTDIEELSPESALRSAQAGNLKLDDLRSAASCCRSCPLYEAATQTVFGEGNPNADIMLVGEQPGDEEDISGRPFVGPAGKVLDRALMEAGLDRRDIYITNTVKHFKWQPAPRGKRRLHKGPNHQEIHACKPWLLAEILKVQPKTLVLLGATAAKAIVRPNFRITEERGNVTDPPPGLADQVVATYHPSAILRSADESLMNRKFGDLVRDLALSRSEPKA